MAEKLPCWRGGSNPPPIPSREWRGSEVTSDEFWANTHKRKTEVQNPEEGNFFLPHDDDKDAQGFMNLVDANTIPRFCVEQRECAMSTINFCAKTKATNGWKEWCLAILKDPKYKSTLKMAGVLDAITVVGKLDVNVCKKALTLLLSRWSSSTHTFIAAWGEFTPTLEDVVTLLRLNVLATDNIMDIKISKLSKEERVINKFLKESITASGKNKSRFSVRGGHSRGIRSNFCAWIRYFYQEVGPSSKNKAGEVVSGPEAGSPYVLEAFIAMWLSKFIFPGPPSEGISAHVFPLAIKIAKGKCFSLATVYLATLYRRLDMVVEEAVRGSKGSNAHACYVDTGFLQMFLWERFPFYAPKRAEYLTNRFIPRAWCWSDVYPLKNFQAHLDMEDHFTFRPYSTVPAGVNPVKASAYEGRKINLNQREQISDDAFIALIMLLPYTFISLVDEGNDDNFSPILYRPERVARQFGLDQGIASVQYTHINAVEASKPLILEHYCDIHKAIGEIPIPSSTRRGVGTPGWFKAWRNVLKTFQEFIWEKVPKPPMVRSLTQPNKGKEVVSSNVKQWRRSNVATNHQDDTVEVDLLSVKRKRKVPTAARKASRGVRTSPYREALGEIGQENEISPAASTENDGPWTLKDGMPEDNLGHLFMCPQNANTVEEDPLLSKVTQKRKSPTARKACMWVRTSPYQEALEEDEQENEIPPASSTENEHPSSETPSNEYLYREDSSDSEGYRSNSKSEKHEDTHIVQSPLRDGGVEEATRMHPLSSDLSYTARSGEPSAVTHYSPPRLGQYVSSSAVTFLAGDPQARAGETEHLEEALHIPTSQRPSIPSPQMLHTLVTPTPPVVGAGNTTCGITPATQYPMIHSPCEMVMWGDISIRANLIPTLERLQSIAQKLKERLPEYIGYTLDHFIDLSPWELPTMRTFIAEGLATCVNLCERYSPRTLPRSDREFIHKFMHDFARVGAIGLLRGRVMRSIMYGMTNDAEALRKEVEDTREKLGKFEKQLATVEKDLQSAKEDFYDDLDLDLDLDLDHPILTDWEGLDSEMSNWALNRVFSRASTMERRYRMRRELFLRILNDVEAYDEYFIQKKDCCGRLGCSSIQKMTAAVRILAYGFSTDHSSDFHAQFGIIL
ncbi:hypothetical protein L1049_021232 [Liquidambar formosana]|uniref:Aminotransferase-like plant mobile domain-containing protein n=1 Tax=Liquidambar formosana TaxID=63359 RepID=A0AAP0S9A4_LIQFO